MLRHRKMPWDERLGARVRVILHHDGLPGGRLVIDDTDHKRSKSAHTLAHLYKLCDKKSGGDSWGHSRLFLLVVTPTITFPVGFRFSQPAPELSAWDTTAKALKKPGVPAKERPPQPPPNPPYPTKQALALRL
jgi:hypothetical protein